MWGETVMRALRRLLVLPQDQRRTAARAAIALLAVRASLRVASVRTVAAALGVRVDDVRRDGRRLALAASRASAAATIVDQLLERGPRETRCVHRALVLGHLLRNEAPCLRIGVRRVDGQVQAHAWLEIGGLVVAEPDLAELATFKTLARP
jgi:hypothetical protein